MTTQIRPREQEREREHLKPEYVADLFDVPVSRVWGWIRAGWLDAVELPRGYRIKREALDRFLANKPWLSEEA